MEARIVWCDVSWAWWVVDGAKLIAEGYAPTYEAAMALIKDYI